MSNTDRAWLAGGFSFLALCILIDGTQLGHVLGGFMLFVLKVAFLASLIMIAVEWLRYLKRKLRDRA